MNEVTVTELRRIATAGGDVMHALKSTDFGYAGFGEAYFSWVEKGAIKAWKKHLRMTMNLVVPLGVVRFVFWDGERFREEIVGGERYVRLTVQPRIWFGFQGVGEAKSLVLNLASIGHDPTEVERKGIADVAFTWK